MTREQARERLAAAGDALGWAVLRPAADPEADLVFARYDPGASVRVLLDDRGRVVRCSRDGRPARGPAKLLRVLRWLVAGAVAGRGPR